MPQTIVFTDEKENKIIIKYSHEWNKSKAETIKEIIRRFEELNGHTG